MPVSALRLAALGAALVAAALSGCSGGSSGSPGTGGCTGECQAPQNFLTVADVQQIIAQAAGEAQARNSPAVITVVDRVGNVLAIFEMTGAPATIGISSGLGVRGGLDGIESGLVPAALSGIAKAVTGAFLSSEGNAFTTRTASQIVQEHFLPHELGQPSGPLFGVQFSQLTCSDVSRNQTHGTIGPQRSPLGLSADPGGMPLYKNGTVVGGIGIEANGVYTIDRDIQDIDQDVEELIAVAGSTGFAAPTDRRADRITAGGVTLRYVDSETLASNPAQAPAFAAVAGRLLPVENYFTGTLRAGTAFGTLASGIVAAPSGPLTTVGGHILVGPNGVNRFPPSASADGRLSATDVETILVEAVKIANRARAQIRRPLGSPAHVSFTVVGSNGDILGLTRTRDGPLFGIDVSAQKARGALFFSHPNAAMLIAAAPRVGFLVDVDPPTFDLRPTLPAYFAATSAFLTRPAFVGDVAWSMRAIGNIHRPYYPDGIVIAPTGPLSNPISSWSPFNVGFQLDLVYNQLLRAILGDLTEGCAGRASAGDAGAPDTGIPLVRNGVQIFPGGVPIYRGGVLVGAIGISGDGVDQDDMIAFLGLHNASLILNNGVGNAPQERRADLLDPAGGRPRYVQCPQAPFNDSSEQNVCAGK